MVEKKVKKNSRKTNSSKKRKTKKNSFESEIKEEIEDIEQWIIERRKFFIKLGWSIILVLGLLIISEIFMKIG